MWATFSQDDSRIASREAERAAPLFKTGWKGKGRPGRRERHAGHIQGMALHISGGSDGTQAALKRGREDLSGAAAGPEIACMWNTFQNVQDRSRGYPLAESPVHPPSRFLV